jgi:hypothetical protein
MRRFISFVVIWLVVVTSVVALQPPPAAEAQSLSEGCNYMNDPFWDSGAAHTLFSGYTLAFNQGEQIVVTAGPPENGTVLGPITLSLSSTVVATAPYPGTLTYTIPANMVAVFQSVGVSGSGTATWDISCGLAPNQPPNCSAASASVSLLWPADHKMVTVGVNGVTDPDGNAVTVTIANIFQDEPVNGPDDGNTAPDGQGVGTGSAAVRAERAGMGNGRVYHIGFTASDGNGGACSGMVMVGVPLNSGDSGGPVDGGAVYDSTGS